MTSNALSEVHALLPYYKSGKESIADAFFGPCLAHCTQYKRAAGYFSSSALKTWSAALLRIVNEKVSIQLLISPELSERDAEAMRFVTDETFRAAALEQMADRLIEETLLFTDDPDDVERRIRLLTWLIAAEQLELRFAIPKHVDDPGIFHEKSGVFAFQSQEKVAFSGSANETSSGHRRNYEKLLVFRSWILGDESRVTSLERDFDEQWRGDDDGLIVRPLSKQSLHLIKSYAPDNWPRGNEVNRPPTPARTELKWRHQDEAARCFLQQRRGILEMATGTGKTRTALNILAELTNGQLVDAAIICTDGTDLLDQWARTLADWNLGVSRPFTVLRNYGQHHQAQTFSLDPRRRVLVISRQQLRPVLRQLSQEAAARILLIHDEVHGLGAPQCRKDLSELHAKIGFVLGLSATPEREYDLEGSAFITTEVGPTIYEFGLREAIERGILCEFDYVALEYHLTENDKRRLAAAYSRQAARKRDGNPMSQEELWTELARVYKTAEEKPDIFRGYLAAHPDIVKGTIFFVEEQSYGDRILPLLHQYTHLYRTYYADDDRQNLVRFSRGEIDCLITCHRISQGIDIQDLKAVVLFSSSRARLETIQRIGRCLRADPNNPTKRALVIDFIRVPDANDTTDSPGTTDESRREWLQELSKTRRKE